MWHTLQRRSSSTRWRNGVPCSGTARRRPSRAAKASPKGVSDVATLLAKASIVSITPFRPRSRVLNKALKMPPPRPPRLGVTIVLVLLPLPAGEYGTDRGTGIGDAAAPPPLSPTAAAVIMASSHAGAVLRAASSVVNANGNTFRLRNKPISTVALSALHRMDASR